MMPCTVVNMTACVMARISYARLSLPSNQDRGMCMPEASVVQWSVASGGTLLVHYAAI
jgi:hypothetical protein